MKKILCLLLAMLMVIGLFAACSSKEDSSTEPESTPESTPAEEEGDAEEGDAAETPVEDGSVTEFTYYRTRLNRNNITDYDDALWVQELQARTNVKITFLGPNSGDDYNEAVNILLASNDVPDLLYHNWNNYNGGLAAALADGLVLDISGNEEYKAMVPNWFNLLETIPGLYASVTLDDGTSAMFCHIENDLPRRGAYQGYIIRKDWLDNVGLDIPDTMDELQAALEAFKAQDANGNGDTTDEIPVTDDSGHSTIAELGAAWGLRWNQPYTAPGTEEITYWTEYKDGEMFKDYAQTMRSWYENGLLDAEFASQEGSQKEAKITSDQAGFYFGYTGNITPWTESLKQYVGRDDVELYGMLPVVGAAGGHYATNDALNRPAAANEGTCLTKTAEERGTVEGILRMINYMYSDEGNDLISWGVEGVSYEVDSEGNKHWTEAVTEDPEYSFNDKVFEFALPTWGSWPKIMNYDAWASIEVTEESLPAHVNWYSSDIDLCMPQLMLTEQEAQEYNQIKTDADTAISETLLNYILGTTDDAGLDAMLTNVDNLNMARAIEIYQGAYDRYLAKLD